MNVKDVSKNHLFVCFTMLSNLIDITPDDIWNQKRVGYVYWQQIVHAITGSLYWLRNNREYTEPFPGLKIYPELENDPEDELTKAQVHSLLNQSIHVASDNAMAIVAEKTKKGLWILEESFLRTATRTHTGLLIGPAVIW